MLKFLTTVVLLAGLGCNSRLTSPPAHVEGASAVLPATILAGALRISPLNTRITFLESAPFSSHEGTFTRFSGWLAGAEDNVREFHLNVVIDMSSVFTEIPLLTKHLKSADFFDAEKYPTATFSSDHIDRGAGGWITGEFNFHGVTRLLSFPARAEITPDAIEIGARFVIRQSEFGVDSSRSTNDEVRVSIIAHLSNAPDRSGIPVRPEPSSRSLARGRSPAVGSAGPVR